MRSTIQLTALALATLAACDKAYDGGGLAVDPNAPRVDITSPKLGTIAGDVKTVTVSGIAHDDTAVASVTVNGVTAQLSPAGNFTVEVPVTPGTNLLEAVATDGDGNTGKTTRAVSAGATRSLTTVIPDAIMASISAQTFDAVSRGATTYVKTANLTDMVTPHNPVLMIGGTNPDCLYGHASITGIKLGDAKIALSPMAGGLFLDADLDHPLVDMHLDYAAACINGSRDISIAATHIHVAGLIALGIGDDGKLTSAIQNPDVTITSLDLELGGIPGDVVNLIHLDTAIGPIIGWATEKFVAPVIANAIQGAADSKAQVLGQTVDIKLTPSRLDFDVTGALISMDTQLRAENDSILDGFVFTDNVMPKLTTDDGFHLAIADDAANELLTSMWSAKAFDKSFALDTGSYGEVGKLYDHVEISVAVPPFVDASGSELVLTLGDLGITFKNGDTVATKVLVNARIALKVTAGMDGKLRIDAGQPDVNVDVSDAGVSGANDLSQADFEQIVSFALSRAVSYGSGAVGAIPLPSAGGVGVTNLGIRSHAGYLMVDGNVQ